MSALRGGGAPNSIQTTLGLSPGQASDAGGSPEVSPDRSVSPPLRMMRFFLSPSYTTMSRRRAARFAAGQRPRDALGACQRLPSDLPRSLHPFPALADDPHFLLTGPLPPTTNSRANGTVPVSPLFPSLPFPPARWPPDDADYRLQFAVSTRARSPRGESAPPRRPSGNPVRQPPREPIKGWGGAGLPVGTALGRWGLSAVRAVGFLPWMSEGCSQPGPFVPSTPVTDDLAQVNARLGSRPEPPSLHRRKGSLSQLQRPEDAAFAFFSYPR